MQLASARGWAKARTVISGLVLLALASSGVAGVLYFWGQILGPGDLSAVSLPVVALAAGVAATFNPCSLPLLPGFLTFVGGSDDDMGVRRRSGLSLTVSLGAASTVIVMGIVVAVVGAGAKELIAPYFRWVQLFVGLVLMGLATFHLLGRSHGFPGIAPIVRLGGRMWDGAVGTPTPRSAYLFGAGFVAVGAG